MESPDLLLQLRQVSRVFPRDVSHIASSVLREMFLPLSALRRCPPGHFHALRGANLALARGQKVGVLGAHRSGKSTLAGIAAGQLQPTSGRVTANGLRSLVARPGAGFRPGLSVVENLQFRTMLHGVTGEEMHATVERTLDLCGIGRDLADKAIGNLSRFVTRQLGLTLLLELPADILIVDEVTGAGTGEARWELRGRLQDYIETVTSLVLSADPAFIRDMVSQAYVLHGGRLYGPFEMDQAIDAYERLPVEEEAEDFLDAVFDPLDPPSAVTGITGALSEREPYEVGDSEPEENVEPLETNSALPKRRSARWYASSIAVDGKDFRHSRESLLRDPGTAVAVTVELTSLVQQKFEGGTFGLFGSDRGIELGRHQFVCEVLPVSAGQSIRLSFEVFVPDWGEAFYGLAFSPKGNGDAEHPRERVKILIVGVGCQTARAKRMLDIRHVAFEFVAPVPVFEPSVVVASGE